MLLLTAVLLAVYLAYQLFNSILPHFLLVPPQRWQDKFLKVMKHDKPIYLKVGMKRSSMRRRLVLASSVPSFYTNFRNNKLKISPQDSANEKQFMEETRRRDVEDPQRRIIYGFFHPYANNGGGGEKVLWQAVRATLQQDAKNICVVYTTNLDAEPLDILNKAQDRFHVGQLDSCRVVFIYLRQFGKLVDGAYWKRFTMIGQLVGTMLLSFEAAFELSPDVWVDTMGLPGSYIVAAKVLRVPVVAYVHYPILQEDMFNKLKYRKLGDLTSIRSGCDVVSYGKLIYWSALYYFYVYLGSLVDLTLANGTWTYRHLQKIWYMNKGMGHSMEILYPPCGTEELTSGTTNTKKKENRLLYLAQFRPEKRHILVLKEFQQFLANNYPNLGTKTSPTAAHKDEIPTLVFAGSCRTKDDTATLEFLRSQVDILNLGGFVTFEVDIPYARVVELLTSCKFGVNAMWNEHFGIGVVEYVARGCIPVVHASAGPYLDIVFGGGGDNNQSLGYFFKSFADPDFDGKIQTRNEPEGYLTFKINGETKQFPTLEHLLTEMFVTNREMVSDSLLEAKRRLGQEIVREKFSNAKFDTQWVSYIEQADDLEKSYRNDRRGKLVKVY
ncbi:uncharacterized protein LODBEIA_P41550 [Lodderomyces beijingensis]|uniref:GDP-Man:Man(3)GlcNAc(2)-PP-Dol alpha-1,2-mannosyltransferase n=1 Tax=Lodderomyces beijingensis TaxID=1775926 RepID=A0ABP0ZSL0_9ASCO